MLKRKNDGNANSNRQIVFGAMLSYLGIGFSTIAGLVYTPWMIAKIGESDYGIYTLITTVISLFTMDFGVGTAITRFVSKANTDGDQNKANNYISAAYRLYLALDVVFASVLFIIYLFADKIYTGLTAAELATLKPVFLCVAAYTVTSLPFTLFSGILTSYEQFIALKFTGFLHKVLGVVLTVACLLLDMGLYALIFANIVNGLIMYTIQFVVIKRKTPVKVDLRKRYRDIEKEIVSYCLLMAVQLIAQRFIFSVTPSVLGIVSNSTQIAIFGIITTLEGYSFALISAISGMFMPRVTNIIKDDKDVGNILPLMTSVGKILLALYVLLYIGFAFFGKSFIQLWMGDGYETAYYGLLLILIPGIFEYPQQIANTAVYVTNRLKEQGIILTIMAATNMVLLFPLGAWRGALGAGISITIAYTVRTALNLRLYRKMGIDVCSFWKSLFKVQWLPAVITVISAIAIRAWIPINGWFKLACCCGAVVAVYGVTYYLFVLRKMKKRAR